MRTALGDCHRHAAGGTVIFHDPGAICEILARTDEDFLLNPSLGREASAAPLAGNRAVAWAAARRAAGSVVNGRVADASLSPLGASIETLLAPYAGRTVDLSFVLEEACGWSMSRHLLPEATDETIGYARSYARAAGAVGAWRIAPPMWLPLPALRRVRRANAQLERALARLVEDARLAGESGSLVGVLAASREIEVSIAAKVLKNVLLAAWTSPGAVAPWVLERLVLHRTWRRRIAAEHGAGGEAAIAHAFVAEVLRLFPPLWLLHRRVVKPVRIAAFRLSPGDSVAFSPYLVHRDSRWWGPASDEFDPARWLAPDRALRRGAYLPFSAGIRPCFASRVAKSQLVALTIVLATRYDAVLREAPLEASFLSFLRPRAAVGLLADATPAG